MFGFKKHKPSEPTEAEVLARIHDKARRNNTEIGLSVFPHAPDFKDGIGVIELDATPPASAYQWEKSLFGRDIAQNKRGDSK